MTVALPVQGSVSLSILPQAVWADKTQLPAPPLPVIQDPSTCPPWREGWVRGDLGRDGEVGERELTTLGTTFPSDPSPRCRPDWKLKTKQQQRLISFGFARSALCAYHVYWKDHYTGWTMCTRCFQPLTLQLVGRDLFLVIQTLHRLHKSESQLSQHELISIETT